MKRNWIGIALCVLISACQSSQNYDQQSSNNEIEALSSFQPEIKHTCPLFLHYRLGRLQIHDCEKSMGRM